MLVDSVAILPDDGEAERRHALITLAAAKLLREPLWLRLRRQADTRRQDGIGHLGLIAGQTVKKGSDFTDVVAAQLGAKPARAHDGNCLFEIPGLTTVKVG